MEWTKVATKAEIGPGQSKIIHLKGKEIGLFCTDGQYYAVLNYCPHQGAPICLGRIFGAVIYDEPGKLDYDHDRHILRCPWHHWEFDLKTGKALAPIREKIKTYPVRINEEDILIAL